MECDCQHRNLPVRNDLSKRCRNEFDVPKMSMLAPPLRLFRQNCDAEIDINTSQQNIVGTIWYMVLSGVRLETYHNDFFVLLSRIRHKTTKATVLSEGKEIIVRRLAETATWRFVIDTETISSRRRRNRPLHFRPGTNEISCLSSAVFG